MSLHKRKEAPCGQGLYLLLSPWYPELLASGLYIAFGELERKKVREKEREGKRKKRRKDGIKKRGRDG